MQRINDYWGAAAVDKIVYSNALCTAAAAIHESDAEEEVVYCGTLVHYGGRS